MEFAYHDDITLIFNLKEDQISTYMPYSLCSTTCAILMTRWMQQLAYRQNTYTINT